MWNWLPKGRKEVMIGANGKPFAIKGYTLREVIKIIEATRELRETDES